MALVFPSDKELFEDLNTIGFDGTDISQHIEKRSFGIIYKAKLDEMLDVDNKNIVSAETESDAIEQIKQGNHQDYLDMEKTVNAYLNNYKTIGYFPGSEMNWYAAKNINPVGGDYFNEMNKSFGFMKGIGYFGKQLKLSNKKLKEIQQLSDKEAEIKNSKPGKIKNGKSLTSISFLFIVFGLILILAGGGSLPVVPDFLTVLINTNFWVRRVIALLTGLLGILVMSMTNFIMEDDSEDYHFTKIPGNGIVTLGVCLYSVMSAYSTFSDANIAPIGFAILGLYYIFYSICVVMDDKKSTLKLNKKAESEKAMALEKAESETISAKLDYCMGVEAYVNELHRYLRFHILWWNNINPDKPLPTGITELKKSFDYILEMYNQYN